MAEKTLSLPQLQEKRQRCRGCRDDFYNYGRGLNGHCWSLPAARLVWRWRINMWTPMDRRENFTRVRVYNCYHGEGNQRDIYMARLPAHLGGDWADKREQSEAETPHDAAQPGPRATPDADRAAFADGGGA